MTLPALYRSGYTISQHPLMVNYVQVYPGDCRDQNDTVDISAWGIFTPLAKRHDLPWTPGAGGGCIAPGYSYPGASSWYFVWVVRNPTTGVIDFCTTTSLASGLGPGNMGSTYGFTQFRLIGAFRTMTNAVQAIDMRNSAPGAMTVNYLKPHAFANGMEIDNYVITTAGASLNLVVNVPPMGVTTYASVPFNANVAIYHPTLDSGISIVQGQCFWTPASGAAGPLLNLTCKAGQWSYANMDLLADFNGTVLVRALQPNTVISLCTLRYQWPSGWLI